MPALSNLKPGTPPVMPIRYAYRSFDRHWVLKDNRLCDRPRPSLLRSASDCQIYITSLLTKVLGEGPSAVATALIPDMDHFCNRGARDVIPLWRDATGTDPNITTGVIELLSKTHGGSLSPENLFAYCYGILATPMYVETFWDELTIPGIRIPITKDKRLFKKMTTLGRQLIWLHTFGERFVPKGKQPGKVPSGKAKCKVGTPTTWEKYPDASFFNPDTKELYVGEGVFSNVRKEVWEFSVSGLEVVKSWLAYRMRKRAGKKSSLLDDIRPSGWEFDGELLDLIWVLEGTIDLLPQVTATFQQILGSDVFVASDFPEPADIEREGPKAALAGETMAFDFVETSSEDNGEVD